MADAVVLYPTAAIGHLISMVELSKLLLTHRPSLSIHILITAAPYNAGNSSPYVDTVSATTPSINFHNLPTITLPSLATQHHETLTMEVLRLSLPNVHQALLFISKSYKVHAFIMDFFCAAALSVANEIKIPSYFFLTSGAAFLAFSFYWPTLHRSTNKNFKDLNTILHIPGLPPLPSSDVPMPCLDREDKAYQYCLEFATNCYPKSAGIIINTFELLEERVVKAISDGLCLPNDPTPPIYCIGPLIASEDRRVGANSTNNVDDTKPECLTWLDSQPNQSVVFLCFGSLGLFSKEQLTEIAIGLERSGQRFLWVVRNPPSNKKNLALTKQPDPDLSTLLPQGFLDRTKERGLVVKKWAPQVAVLSHDSVGGFVTHCGWNSVLEAVCAGVPMVAWPLYAEQRINRILLVEEIRIALSMKEDENGFVSAEEVESRVTELMEAEVGKLVRERMVAMKNEAKAALSKGCSSYKAVSKLVNESWN